MAESSRAAFVKHRDAVISTVRGLMKHLPEGVAVTGGLAGDGGRFRETLVFKGDALIVDPFFTTKEVGKGTGQGLAIAHSVIVKKHGGTLRFETECGKGTTFFIRLPIDAPPASAIPIAA